MAPTDRHFIAFWSEQDQEWVGTCSDYPSMSWLDESPAKALEGIRLVSAAEDDSETPHGWLFNRK